MLSLQSLTSLRYTWIKTFAWRIKIVIINWNKTKLTRSVTNPASMNPKPKTPMAARARFDFETVNGKKDCCWDSLLSWTSFFLANVVQNLLLAGREGLRHKTLKLLPMVSISYLLIPVHTLLTSSSVPQSGRRRRRRKGATSSFCSVSYGSAWKFKLDRSRKEILN